MANLRKRMKYSALIILAGFFILTCYPAKAQQYLVVQKLGSVKNFKYQPGDEIALEVNNGDFTIQGEITHITDTSLSINSYIEVKFNSITAVLRPRIFFTKLSKLFFIRGGIAYVTIVGINGIINNDSPLIDEQTIAISAAMVAIGFALKPFYIRKLNTVSKWEIKTIDFENIPMLVY